MKRVIVIAFMGIVIASCGGRIPLRVEYIERPRVEGTYRLMLVGSTAMDDPERVAILDPLVEPHRIVPREPAFRVRIADGLPGADALKLGVAYISNSCAFRSVEYRRVLIEGRAVAYEVRGDYERGAACGAEGEIATAYSLAPDGTTVDMYMHMLNPRPGFDDADEGTK